MPRALSQLTSQAKMNNKRFGNWFFSIAAIHSLPQRLSMPKIEPALVPWILVWLRPSHHRVKQGLLLTEDKSIAVLPSCYQKTTWLFSVSPLGLSSFSVTLEQGSQCLQAWHWCLKMLWSPGLLLPPLRNKVETYSSQKSGSSAHTCMHT